ncbi:MAG: pirin family protein [Patescibacteria group bacterium]|nr:pirin family protein [Patescibacteria group bacterium]MDE1944292.1 pirin family protein [Patescibacteria group bacterium]MDE2057627.1 pirin family protein [Patescibacteria group bacterium]
MAAILHRAEERGRGDYGWLKTRYSFSFADWYEPTRMGFGALRVINDDTIAAGQGFGPHPHRDMEIVTIVTRGTVAHQDSAGNTGVTRAGEVQVMSAGTGIVHAEANASAEEPLSLFQVWITPREAGLVPRYVQQAFDFDAPGATLLAAPTVASGEGRAAPSEDGGALTINQDAHITLANVAGDFAYALRDPAHGVYLFVVSGAVEIAGATLRERDALGVTGARAVETRAPQSGARVLIFEVPMIA